MINKICEVCGTKFEVNEKIITERRRKYCCDDCAKIAQSKHISSYKVAHRKPPENVECAICGKIFLTNNPRIVTCSLECQQERKKRLERERLHRQTKIYKVEQRAEAAQIRKQKRIATVEDMQKKAREAGMSYGQYTALLYMQEGRTRNGRC